MKVWVEFFFFNELETKQHLTSGREKKCSIMHSHWTNERDIKLQFYALKRFETRQVPFCFRCIQILFVYYPRFHLAASLASASLDARVSTGCIILFGCIGMSQGWSAWQDVFTPLTIAAWRKERGDGCSVKENGGRGRRQRTQGKSRGWRAKAGKKNSRSVCHCSARLWSGSYLWRACDGCKERQT